MPIHGYLGGVISATAPSVTTAGASGVFTLEEQLQASAQNNWPGYQISRSVRLRASASAYFNRTLSTPTNNKIWTFSCWFKRGQLTYGASGASGALFFAPSSGSTFAGIYFTPGDLINWYDASGGATVYLLQTTQVFRDPSAWYHLVCAYDSTQATSTDRQKMYVNGVQITSFASGGSSYVAQNTNGRFNSAVSHTLGEMAAGPQYFDGYLTEINFIDGQALTPASFGVTDSVTGVWNPIRYSGTYGTNGFYLNFKDPTSTTTIAYDYSGNSNNWTANNISVTAGTTYDSMVDVPIGYGGDTGVGGELRGNYCTLNPLNKQSNLTLSSANLDTSSPVTGIWRSVVGTVAMTSGKWYWEATAGATGAGNHYMVGVASTSFNALTDNVYVGSTTDTWSYYGNNGTKYNNGAAAAYGASYTTNDVISITYDADNGTLAFYKNGVSQGTAFTGLSGAMVAGTSAYNGSGMYHNFGQRQFVYTAPSGYKALCTTNLSTPTISNGANYMAALLYTGTGVLTTRSGLTLSSAPGLVWIKSRSAATSNVLEDSNRGTSVVFADGTNSTAAEGATGGGWIQNLSTTGFSTDVNLPINTNAATYVAWVWAGASNVSNTAGSITSTVSANTTAGFSVVTYTGTGVNATVGHGLGVVPAMIIAKRRSAVQNWGVWHTSLAGTQTLYLDLTQGVATGVWNGTPSSTLFNITTDGVVNASTSTYVAYCFAAITGYSAFGSYTGNGSTDGPFVYCGFRPRFVLVKDTTNVTYWEIGDSSRNTYNAVDANLYPNSAFAEAADPMFDFLANGFKVRKAGGNFNNSGAATIYAAFAENPFTIARAR